MDLGALRTFVKVSDLGSFTRAAEQLGLRKSAVSLQVKGLEESLGVRLFHRTTRSVRPTPDGEQLAPRARALLAEAEELGSMFQASQRIRGRVRMDLPVVLAREVVVPRLPELVALHPGLELLVSTTDRRVQVVPEGFDMVVRVGTLSDSSLVARRLGAFPMANAASPAYLRRHGTPRKLADLARHLVVHYSHTLGGDGPSFDHVLRGRVRSVPMKSLVTVNNTDAYQAACVAGLGIIQAPRRGLDPLFQRGVLTEILPAFTEAPMPVSLVHGHGRTVPTHVRVVMDWLADVLRAAL